jgi:hypothetical protein
MPPSVSNLSLKMIDSIRLTEEMLPRARFPVWVETRQVTGYFDALALRELCKEREDLSYIPKVVRNADRGDVPGFTFDQDGEETLDDYFKALDRQIAASPAAVPEQTAGSQPAIAPGT